MDPFAGGGTALVESRVEGRLSIGTDISALANFVARAKTRVYSSSDLSFISEWFENFDEHLSARGPFPPRNWWRDAGYLKNLDSPEVQPIADLLETALTNVSRIQSRKLQDFVRCVLLRTSQWALDGRREIPSTTDFRTAVATHAVRMRRGAEEFSSRVRLADRAVRAGKVRRTVCLKSRAEHLAGFLESFDRPAPRLIITSPPYPGVHILYHRWQVHGGRETPAPFWVANQLDGSGESFYLMNARSHDLSRYLRGIATAFTSIRRFASYDSVLVQVLAFSRPQDQLPRYLSVIDKCGFQECFLDEHLDSIDGRIWRSVPGRKWHANKKGSLSSGREVVLLHKPK